MVRRLKKGRGRKLTVLGRRKCGECTECCTALEVTELGMDQGGKVEGFHVPKWERCEHQTEKKGCAVYSDRPQACRGFKCGWLKGIGDLADRPDKIGVVFYLEDTSLGVTMIAHELEPGTIDYSDRAQALMDSMATKLPVITIGRRENGEEYRSVRSHDPEVLAQVRDAQARVANLEVD